VSLLEICTIKIFTANGGCTLTSAECRYSVQIWKARICSGLGFIGQISKRHHFAAQSLRSVTQPAQIFEELIFGSVHFIEQRLVCAEAELVRRFYKCTR
jgi:hypothetical protein